MYAGHSCPLHAKIVGYLSYMYSPMVDKYWVMEIASSDLACLALLQVFL